MAEASEFPPQKKMKYDQRNSLNDFCDTIATTATVDYNNTELKDIQIAVDTMLKTIMTRVNERGVFKIASIQPGGSMAEETSIWKFHWDVDPDDEKISVCNHERPFLEFDYLAVLEGSIQDVLHVDQTCPGCVKLTHAPVDFEELDRIYNREDGYTKATLKDKSVLNELFWHETNGCLTSFCDCMTFNSDHTEWKFNRQLAFQRKSSNLAPSCDQCSVTMPTGTLGVAILPSNQVFPNYEDCSLIFQWTSKAKSLFAPDKLLLHRPQQLSSLLIYVDFLPALEYRADTPNDEDSGDDISEIEEGNVHDYYMVPKQCNVCVFTNRVHIKNYESPGKGWRKSWCKAELNVFANEMSDKHKRCYQILKYFRELVPGECINNYHMKIALLRHNATCSDTKSECEECVVKLFQQLRKYYESKKLVSPYSNQNLLRRDGYYDIQKRFCEMRLDDLFSVSETECWQSFVKKCCLDVSSLSS